MQANSQDDIPDVLTTGLPISWQDFRAMVADYLQRMQTDAALTVEDYLTLVRLWNTIDLRRLSRQDSLYHDFAKAFYPAYAERIVKHLHAIPSKGMALYSREYDIYLGGKPHANSQYRLEGAPI